MILYEILYSSLSDIGIVQQTNISHILPLIWYTAAGYQIWYTAAVYQVIMRRLWKKLLNQWKSLIATELLKHSPYKTFIGLVKTSIFDRYDEIGFKQASIWYLSRHYVAHQISNFCLFSPNFKWYWSVQDLILGSPPRRLNPISNPGQTNINHICQRLVLTRPINNSQDLLIYWYVVFSKVLFPLSTISFPE